MDIPPTILPKKCQRSDFGITRPGDRRRWEVLKRLCYLCITKNNRT